MTTIWCTFLLILYSSNLLETEALWYQSSTVATTRYNNNGTVVNGNPLTGRSQTNKYGSETTTESNFERSNSTTGRQSGGRTVTGTFNGESTTASSEPKTEECENPPCPEEPDTEGNGTVDERLLRKKVCYPLLGCFGRYDFFDLRNRPINFLPSKPEEINIAFHLFTGRNRDKSVFFKYDATPETIMKSTFDSNKKTKFIVHGFLDQFKKGEGWMNDLKKLILDITPNDYNVFVLDWSGGSKTINYYQAVSNTRVVGAALAHFIHTLGNLTGFRMKDVHIIGHSLGSHIAGYAGERVQNPQIGRITGLDPAGPSFYDRNGTLRLSADDAVYVDNLHTDGGTSLVKGFGTNEPLGVSDFYPNGGKDQPGCEPTRSISKVLEQGIVKGISTSVSCSHNRATIVIMEDPRKSDKNCQFVGYPCESWESFQKGECGECNHGALSCDIFNIWSVPSADARKFEFKHNITSLKPEKRKLYFKTASKAPFCLQHYQIIIHVDKNSLSAKGIVTLTIDGTQGGVDSFEVGGGSMEYKDGLPTTHLYTERKAFGRAKSINVQWKFGGTLLTNLQGVIRSRGITIEKISVNYLSNIKPEIRKSMSSVLCPPKKEQIKNGESMVFTECAHNEDSGNGNGGRNPNRKPNGGREDEDGRPNRGQGGNRGNGGRYPNRGSENDGRYPNRGSDNDYGNGEPGRQPNRGSGGNGGRFPNTDDEGGRNPNRNPNNNDQYPPRGNGGREPGRDSSGGRYPNRGSGDDDSNGGRYPNRGSTGNNDNGGGYPNRGSDGSSGRYPNRGSGSDREPTRDNDYGGGDRYPNRGNGGRHPGRGSAGDRNPNRDSEGNNGSNYPNSGGRFPNRGSEDGRQPSRGTGNTGGGRGTGVGFPSGESGDENGEGGRYPNRGSSSGRGTGGSMSHDRYPNRGTNGGRNPSRDFGDGNEDFPNRGGSRGGVSYPGSEDGDSGNRNNRRNRRSKDRRRRFFGEK